MGREGIEPTLLIESDCFTDSLDSQVQSTHVIPSVTQAGFEPAIAKVLSFAAVPVRVPRHPLVVRVGLEPTNTEVLSSAAMPISAPHHAKVARQGIEPCLTVSKTVVRNPITLASHVVTSVSMSGIEPDLRPSQGRVRIHYTSQTFFT